MTDPYHCSECGTGYVVPSLATDCASRHLAQEVDAA